MRGRDLPDDVRDRLARLARGERIDGHAALPIASRRIALRVAIASASALVAAALCIALWLTNFGGRRLWTVDDDFAVVAIVVAISTAASIASAWSAMVLARSRIRPALIATPALLVATGYDDEDVAVETHAHDPRLAIAGSEVRASVGGSTVRAHAGDGAAARRFVESAEAFSRDGRAFPDPEADWRSRAQRSGSSLAPLGRAVASLAIAAVLALPAASAAWVLGLARVAEEHWSMCTAADFVMCDYASLVANAELDFPPAIIDALGMRERAAEQAAHDDARLWQYASEGERPSSLRAYLERPAPAHADEARSRLASLYADRVARHERDARTSGADPGLASGLTRLLVAVGSSPDPYVGIVIAPEPGLETGAIEALFSTLTTARVAPLAPAFTPDRNRARETAVLEAVREAAGRSLGDYVGLLTGSEDEDPRIEIRYRVEPSGAIYSNRAEATLPEQERTAYPGLRIVFACAIVVGTTPFPAAEIVAEPAPDLFVTGEGGAPSSIEIYDRMIETAFDQLRDRLVRAFGGTPPSPGWIAWLPEVPGAARDPGVSLEVRVSGEPLDVSERYRAQLGAIGMTSEPYGSPDSWLVRDGERRAVVRFYSTGAFVPETVVRVGDVSELPL